MRLLRQVLTEPVRARTWRRTGHLLLGLPVSAACLLLVAAAAYALIASITVVGLFAPAAVVTAARWIGALERRRAGLLLGLDIPPPVARRRTRPGPAGWVRDALADRTGRRHLLYALIAAPVGAAQAYAVAVWWVMAFSTATYGLWYRLTPSNGTAGTADITVATWRWSPSTWPHPLMVSAAGLAALLAAPWLVHGLTGLDRLRLRLLAPPEGRDERLTTLERQRDHAVEQAGAHLRRLERDLHDGAQMRVVALALELGRAREELEQDGGTPQAVRRVSAAHEEAKLALVELRELARGIYPAVLSDLGLAGAVPMLTARCPIPVTADVDLRTRPPATVEATAYFCIGELLANLCKHSRADAGWVRVRRHGDRLSVEVGDDGVGGAAAHPLGGLAGLADRADGVGGTLTVDSPPGGPTVVSVELPCAS